MLELMNQMDTQENIVKVDLLHLDPTDPDGPTRTEAAAAAITAADIAADGTVTDRRTSLMRKSEK